MLRRTSESADNGGIPIFASKNRIVQNDQLECRRSVDGEGDGASGPMRAATAHGPFENRLCRYAIFRARFLDRDALQ